MATNDYATPPNGLWKGLAVNGTHGLRTELNLTFAESKVTGRFTVHGSHRRTTSGEVNGSYLGSTVSLAQVGNASTFEGQVRPAGRSTWILFGLLTSGEPEAEVGTLTAFHTGTEVQVSSVWDGEAFE